MLRLAGLLAGIYPVVAHIGLWAQYPEFSASYLAGMCLLLLLYPPGYQSIKNIIVALVLVALFILLLRNNQAYYLLYLPPVLIPLALMLLFARSLGDEETPLITRFAMQFEKVSLSEEKKAYTRNVTRLWVMVFAIMCIESLLLAIYASLETWSWFAHIGNYLLISFVLVVEFVYRQLRFKESNGSLREFLVALRQYKWK